jgi:hypothetical protein
MATRPGILGIRPNVAGYCVALIAASNGRPSKGEIDCRCDGVARSLTVPSRSVSRLGIQKLRRAPMGILPIDMSLASRREYAPPARRE